MESFLTIKTRKSLSFVNMILHVERLDYQYKRMAISEVAFLTREVFGTFKKRLQPRDLSDYFWCHKSLRITQFFSLSCLENIFKRPDLYRSFTDVI